MATRSAILTRVITPSAISKPISRRRARPSPPRSPRWIIFTCSLAWGGPRFGARICRKKPPRALQPEAQKRFLRAVERCTSVRDRALALLLFYTALRIGECASLDTDDVAL